LGHIGEYEAIITTGVEEEEANFGPGNQSLEERASDRRAAIDADGEEEFDFGPGNPSLEERASDRRAEIDADGEEEFDFGPGNPSLEERASDRRTEIEAEELDQSGIDGEECSEDGDEARIPKIRRAPRGPTQLEREQH